MRKIFLLCILTALLSCNITLAQDIPTTVEGRTYEQWLSDAEYFRQNAEYDKAIKAATNALLLNNKSDYAYFIKGMSYARLGIYHQAGIELTEAININSRQSLYYIWRAYSYSQRHISEDAAVDFTKAIELDPDTSYSYFKRAQCYQHMNRHKEALADFAIAENKDNSSIYIPFFKAMSFEALGEKENAITNYKLFVQAVKGKKVNPGILHKAEDKINELEQN